VNDSWFFVSHRLPIAVSAIEAGYTVHVFAKEDDTTATIISAGCQFHPWKISPRGQSLLTEIPSLLAVFTIVRKLSPDVLHLVTIKSVIYGGLAARFKRPKVVVVAVAGMGAMFDTQHRIIGKLQPIIRWVYRQATKHRRTTFIFQNTNDKKLFSSIFKLPESNTRLFHGSGVHLQHYDATAEPESPPIVIMGARLIREKGVYEFIEAARSVKASLPHVRFQLAGGTLAAGHPSAVTEADLIAANHDHVVELLGHVSSMQPLMQAATLVTLPSYYNEGLPKFLAEAAAAGRPVVTTDHPGCRDAVEDGVTGVTRDAPALGNAILQLLNDDAQRTAMGTAARTRATQLFDVKTIAENHLAIYEEGLR